MQAGAPRGIRKSEYGTAVQLQPGATRADPDARGNTALLQPSDERTRTRLARGKRRDRRELTHYRISMFTGCFTPTYFTLTAVPYVRLASWASCTSREQQHAEPVRDQMLRCYVTCNDTQLYMYMYMYTTYSRTSYNMNYEQSTCPMDI